MTTAFSADDLMKRSLFGLLIGFGKKKPKNVGLGESNKNRSRTECLAGCSFRTSTQAALPEIDTPYLPILEVPPETLHLPEPSNAQSPDYCPSEQEIYREIVAECAKIEEIKGQNSPTLHPEAVADLSNCAPNITVDPSQLPSRLTGDNFTIEEFVKLVVTLVKENSLHFSKLYDPESPEEILKKKRLQNNEAAARYRRRQRELRKETEIEVRILENKNSQLRAQIERMQHEIDNLKDVVLRKNS